MKSYVIIYRYTDYKKYIFAVEYEYSRFEKGFRSRLAEDLDVQSAFVSKVLNQGKVHFTLEQGYKLAEHLKLNQEERSYLMWMLELARAGTKELRSFFQNLISEAQSRHLNIKNRVGESLALSDQEQARYYSHWLYGAVHMLTTVPHINTQEKMANALQVETVRVHDILVFLIESGLVISKNDQFLPGSKQLHLSKDSANISKHHTNWRLKAIDNAADSKSDGIHYSTVSSFSEKDFEKLTHELTEVIQNYVSVIRDSKEETVGCFNLDFFKLVK